MTVPSERTRAVLQLGDEVEALRQYLHGYSEAARVPRETIRRLVRLLRHYPTRYDLEVSAGHVPHLWGPPE